MSYIQKIAEIALIAAGLGARVSQDPLNFRSENKEVPYVVTFYEVKYRKKRLDTGKKVKEPFLALTTQSFYSKDLAISYAKECTKLEAPFAEYSGGVVVSEKSGKELFSNLEKRYLYEN